MSPGLLIAEDVLLGRHILRHVLVDVQMVGGQIGHHGDMGAAIHGHQLEAGQLQHRPVLRLHIIRLDTAAGWPMLPPTWTVLPAAFSSSAMMVVVVVLPSLPVTAIIVAGADLKEHLHLAR